MKTALGSNTAAVNAHTLAATDRTVLARTVLQQRWCKILADSDLSIEKKKKRISIYLIKTTSY